MKYVTKPRFELARSRSELWCARCGQWVHILCARGHMTLYEPELAVIRRLIEVRPSRYRLVKRYAASSGIALLAWGCARPVAPEPTYLSAGETAHELSSTLCQKDSECEPVPFGERFPLGVAQCTFRLTSAAIRSVDTSRPGACTQPELKACTEAVSALTCQAFDKMRQLMAVDPLAAWPRSCQEC